jgi:hypothetical protein
LRQDVDARVKPGHDEWMERRSLRNDDHHTIYSDMRNNAALFARGGVFVDAAPRFISPAVAKLCVPMTPRERF